MVVFLMEANSVPDSFGEKCLSCVVAQGISTCFHVVQVHLPEFFVDTAYILVNITSHSVNKRKSYDPKHSNLKAWLRHIYMVAVRVCAQIVGLDFAMSSFSGPMCN